MNAKEQVQTALAELFGKRDALAVDALVAGDYRQHSAMAPDGTQALKDLIGGLSPDFRYEGARMIADGDLVACHGVYYGFGPAPLVAFDLFRVDRDGKLAEHWDALTPVVDKTVSGHTQVDGPVEVTQPDQTQASRALAEDFARTVLIGAQYDKVADFISTDSYIQHNPGVGDGLAGFGAAMKAWAEQGITMQYHKLHRVIAEGEFVLTQSEGALGGKPTAFYDLLRIDDGKIVEHWDVITEIPASLPHNNGLF